MVKVTVEIDGEVRSFEGDMIVGQVLTEEAGGIRTQVMIMGRGKLGTVSRVLAENIPGIFERMSEDPLEAMAAITKFDEALNGKIKEYFVEHVDGIAGAMKEAAEETKGDKGQG